eukprot:m.41729 g.41729  ORF g.41729 m.41729 type:complete len:81 (+) comp16905_c0_seq2:1998-2240(+)
MTFESSAETATSKHQPTTMTAAMNPVLQIFMTMDRHFIYHRTTFEIPCLGSKQLWRARVKYKERNGKGAEKTQAWVSFGV